MGLIFAFAAVEDGRLLPIVATVTLALYRLSGLPIAFLKSRLRYPGFFLLALAIVLPFASGETAIAYLGTIALYREGVVAAIVILTRFFCIFTVSLILLGTSSTISLLNALQSLGFPSLIADMMLLFYRYLFEIGDDLQRMQMAMRLRGFQLRRLSPRTLQILASLAGSLFVRSYERSEQVYLAMKLRGYGYSRTRRSLRQVPFQDAIALAATVIFSVGLAIAEGLILHPH